MTLPKLLGTLVSVAPDGSDRNHFTQYANFYDVSRRWWGGGGVCSCISVVSLCFDVGALCLPHGSHNV